MILKFTDDVRKQTRDEMEIMSINLLDGLPIPENDTPLASEAWKEALYGQETRDTKGRLIATGGLVHDLQEGQIGQAIGHRTGGFTQKYTSYSRQAW